MGDNREPRGRRGGDGVSVLEPPASLCRQPEGLLPPAAHPAADEHLSPQKSLRLRAVQLWLLKFTSELSAEQFGVLFIGRLFSDDFLRRHCAAY